MTYKMLMGLNKMHKPFNETDRTCYVSGQTDFMCGRIDFMCGKIDFMCGKIDFAQFSNRGHSPYFLYNLSLICPRLYRKFGTYLRFKN